MSIFLLVVALISTLFVPSSQGLATSHGGDGSGTTGRKRVSIVTGANGYVGREVVNVLLNSDSGGPDAEDGCCEDEVLCLVRPSRVASETRYWESLLSRPAMPTTPEEAPSLSSTSHPSPATGGGPTRDTRLRVLPYDMLDGGQSIADALEVATSGAGGGGDVPTELCVYHVASVFGPSDDHVQTALDNVQGTKDLVTAIGRLRQTRSGTCNCRLVLTSSMAAVRGSGQTPSNGRYYTHEDWNTLSKLDDANWGSSYQWSKAESERAAWDLAKDHDIAMASVCPSFVFGPPASGDLSGSYSITLVGQWVRGEAPVQSRLCVDIRDVARAHIAAGRRPEAAGQRFIVSTEARVPSEEMARELREVCRETGLGDPCAISFDSDFQGGAIPIGSQEVEATLRLRDLLGINLRPVHET
jgi:nucleoside-diphosphate-sugar epimerase